MRLATATCCLSVLILFVGTVVDAAIVYQQTASHVDANGNAFLAWEAETFASTTIRTPADSAWTSTADASAVGGQTLLATSGSTSAGGATSNIVTYDFQFVKAGTYSLYWSGRANATPVGSNDGWFAPAGGFGDTEPARRVNGYSNDDLVRLGGTNSGDNYATTYQWFGQGGDTNVRIDFTVSAANVSNNDILSLSAAAREDGLMIDRWILSENNNLFGSSAGDTAGELDAFPTAAIAAMVIPEPATLLIWSLLAGLGVGLGWRRRK